MKKFREVLGRILRQKRYEGSIKKMTLSEIATNTSLCDKYLGKIERGEKLPHVHILYNLYVGQGISVDQLFTELKLQLDKQEGAGKKAQFPK